MTMRSSTRCAAGLGVGLWLLATTAGAVNEQAERVTTSLDRVVRIDDVRSTPAEVRALVVNETDDQIENVHLLVSDQFLWRNERHPGSDSPGDAHPVVVPGPIPPRGSTTVRFERPDPLPDRHDGEFVTDIVPTEITRRPMPGYDEGQPSGMSVSPGRSSASTISR